MMICTVKFDKKKAVFWVIMAALVLIGIILLVSALEHGSKPDESPSVTALRTEKARVAFLAANGWKVCSPALKEETVVIPRVFSTVFENYNKLQKEQGFDLSQYCGMEVKLYTYRVEDSSIGENVLAMLYILNGNLIGGDVHSTDLDGYMCAVKTK